MIRRRLFQHLTILLLLAVSSFGCGGVYLHNARNQAAAEAALKEFLSFREKSTNPYAVMLRNLERAKAATADAQRAAAEQRGPGFALGIPYKTWGELSAELNQALNEAERTATKVTVELNDLLAELGGARDVQAGTRATLKAAKKALADQFNRNQRWVAQQALFKHAIQKLAELSTKDTSKLKPKDLGQASEDLLDVEISVQQQTETGQVEVVKKTIRAALEADLPKPPTAFPDVVRKLSGIFLDPESSPGIAITILGLAVDLADAEFRKAQIRVETLEQKAWILDAMQQNVEVSKALLGAAIEDINALPANDPILTSVEALRRPVAVVPGPSPAQDPVVRLGAALRVLGRAAIPTTLLASERLRLDVELASVEHEYSIRVSEVNARAHEALIGRGLEGLAAYHRGGVTPEEIANVIRAAQVIAVGVIGGRL